MGEVRVRSFDRRTLVPAEEITALNVRGTALEADVVSLGVVVLAQGTPEELADAAHSLMPGIDRLGERDHTVEAQANRQGTGIGWVATADDGSGGAGWAAKSSPTVDKSAWPRG